MNRVPAGLIFLFLVLATSWLAIRDLDPPEVVPASAAADVFSAARAMPHLLEIAQRPHPIGSEDHARVRDYVVAQLRSMGLDPEVQKQVVALERGDQVGFVHNVLARIEGSGAEDHAVMLTAHYDTVPASPGVSDDSTGVAALLEATRALLAGEPVRNDVVVLIADGEESGLIGARAFVEHHPWAEDVEVLVNFEARGTRGPATLFETSGGNRWMIEAFADHDPTAFGTSYAYEVYRRLPNLTDVRVYKKAGYASMNFAHFHGAAGYHTALDSIERFDPRSLQGHGNAALGLARGLGNADLTKVDQQTGTAVYFNALGLGFVTYSGVWTLPLAVLLMLAVTAIGIFGVRQGWITGAGMTLGVAVPTVAAAVAGFAAHWTAKALFSGAGAFDFLIWGDQSSTAWTLAGLALVAAAIGVLAYVLARRWLSAEKLAMGGLLLWSIFALWLALLTPGASYLFALPLLAQLIAVVIWLRSSTGRDRDEDQNEDRDDARMPWLALIFFALSAVLATIIWAPTLSLLAAGLETGAATYLAILTTIAVLLLGPQIDGLLALKPRWLLAAALAVTGIGILITARLATGFGLENPRPDSLLFAQDADRGEAIWASFQGRPDAFVGQFIPAGSEREPIPQFIGSLFPSLVAEAPTGDFPAPEIEIVSQLPTADGRRVEVQLRPAAGADRTRLLFEDATVEAVRIDEIVVEPRQEMIEGSARDVGVLIFAPPSDGLRLYFDVVGEEPMRLAVIDQHYGLPSLPRQPSTVRPPEFMQTGGAWNTDSVFVRRGFELPALGDEGSDDAGAAEGAVDGTQSELASATAAPTS